MSENSSQRLDFIFRRRSIRVYAPGDVTDDQVRAVLEAAMAAPSACAKDPWRFIVVRDRETLRRIAEVLPNGKMLATAAVGIVVAGDQNAAHDRQLSYLLQDCSAAMENLLLAAAALGLGACWLGVHPREDRIRKISGILGLPEGVLPIAGVALGRPGETKAPRTRYRSDYVHAERW
jgi:nitroreductase